MNRKVFCGIVEAGIYDQNCLFKLAQTVPNKHCESCIFFENIQLRAKIEELKLAWKKKVHKLSPKRGKSCQESL